MLKNRKVLGGGVYGRKEKRDGKIEVLVVGEVNGEMGVWEVLVEGGGKMGMGKKVLLDDVKEMVGEVMENSSRGGGRVGLVYDEDGNDDVSKGWVFGVGEGGVGG